MPLSIDTTHFAAFLIGTAIGAAGTYMADRFTDARREKERIRQRNDRYKLLKSKMPEFLAAMKTDLKEAPELAAREIAILPSKNSIFDHEKPRMEYYEDELPAIRNWMDMIVEAGFASSINRHISGSASPFPFKTVQAPVFRLSEEFVLLLESDA